MVHTEAITSYQRQTGLQLPEHRRRSGLTLEQIAGSTKISRHFLQSIEAEEFDRLPGGIFDVSYLRQYANAIGYNQEELVAYYRTRVDPEQKDLVPQSKQESHGGRRGKRSLFDWFRALSPGKLF